MDNVINKTRNLTRNFTESNLVKAYSNGVLLELHNAYMIYIGHKFAYTSVVQTYLLYYEYNIYMQGYIDNDLMMRVLSIGGHELPLLVNCV